MRVYVIIKITATKPAVKRGAIYNSMKFRHRGQTLQASSKKIPPISMYTHF